MQIGITLFISLRAVLTQYIGQKFDALIAAIQNSQCHELLSLAIELLANKLLAAIQIPVQVHVLEYGRVVFNHGVVDRHHKVFVCSFEVTLGGNQYIQMHFVPVDARCM